MHAFIVRPFGLKEGIDFDTIERELIDPALSRLEITGRTTAEIVRQGNIRTDMFEKLLIADLVVADITLDNANVFYELGIRHALRDKRTLLIRADGRKDVPFDLRTDRYFVYDANDPGTKIDDLAASLEATLDSDEPDSPVFALLPGLIPTDPSAFLIVPLDYREAVEQASAKDNLALLQLLAAEAEGFAWHLSALRLVGKTQRRLGDLRGARTTWERVRHYDAHDPEANEQLATIYQRLDDLKRSSQAIDRLLDQKGIAPRRRAEAHALEGRNVKVRWEATWQAFDSLETRQQAALDSTLIEQSQRHYALGFAEDRNHYYSGLNALAMLTILLELIDQEALRDTWLGRFETDEEAEWRLRQLRREQQELDGAVRLAIETALRLAEREDKVDPWATISKADQIFLSSRRPSRVAYAYRQAFESIDRFARDSVRSQLEMYQQLGILGDNLAAALKAANQAQVMDSSPEKSPTPAKVPAPRPHVIVFYSHRLDAPDRPTPRFPADCVDHARRLIREEVKAIASKLHRPVLGLAGCAAGGDILFHEVCRDLGVKTEVYLPIPKQAYVAESYGADGGHWTERFYDICGRVPVRTLGENQELPRWLRTKPGYSVWQRCNLWMLQEAIAQLDPNDHLRIVALWDGDPSDRPGETSHIVHHATEQGADVARIDTQKLLVQSTGV